MPERPDLEYAVSVLASELNQRHIVGVDVPRPVVLRVAVPGQPADLLRGRQFVRVRRRGHFVLFDLDGTPALQIVVSPMLAGRFALRAADAKPTADTAVSWALSDGRVLRYRDSRQMGKVYLVLRDRWNSVPGLSEIGVDALDAKTFTRQRFRALADKRRDQVRVFLMDKRAIDALGNAYADEVLWSARLHPKLRVNQLAADELDHLHDAVVDVLSAARDEVARRRPALDDKVRDFLQVRGRKGDPCPRCATKLRRAGVRGYDAIFCPSCQPDRRGSSIVDWRKTSGSPTPPRSKPDDGQ